MSAHEHTRFPLGRMQFQSDSGSKKTFSTDPEQYQKHLMKQNKKKEHRGNLESRTFATGPEQFQGILPNRYPLVV